MGIAALALVVAAPMQLAAAAGLETSAGYDSTVLNPRTLTYGDGAVVRTALDFQLGHQTETLQQILRTRFEFLYTGGEGRQFRDSDYLNLTRYALVWNPAEGTNVGLDVSYSLGRSALLLSRGVSTSGNLDQAYLPGVYADYTGRLELARAFGDRTRGTLEGGSTGRYAIDIPPQQARNNALTFFAQPGVTQELSDKDLGSAAGRVEYFLVDGFPDWVARLTGILGWNRSWSENTITQVNAGLDAIQDQNNIDRFQLGPYVNVGFTQLLPDLNMALGFSFRREFALVAGARCGVRVTNGAQCPRSAVIGGGTGYVNAATFQYIWRPSEDLAFTFDSTFDLGVTSLGVMGSATQTNDTQNLNIVNSVGTRINVSRRVFLFARYDFLFQRVSNLGQPSMSNAMDQMLVASLFPDIIRHFVLVGAEFQLATGDGPLEGILPLEELGAVQGARGAFQGSSAQRERPAATAGGASSGPADDMAISDPFELSAEAGPTDAAQPEATDEPDTPAGGGDGSTETPPTTTPPQGEGSR
ncbi:MAG: hypothetical protein HY909_22525 [Deltaproteobacteria bacterium]|nr:hypothetical protein [Deltaproteobacteria bacterium]